MQEMQEMWIRSLGGEDPLEKEMAPHSSILAWETPWTEEPGGPQSTGSQSWTRLRNGAHQVTRLVSGRIEFWAYFLVTDLSLSNYHSRPKNVYIYKGSAGTSLHYSLSL